MWAVYWFLLPTCGVIASVAMFIGISGAAMLFPIFLIGFPLIGAPPLTTVEAVGLALFLETSGFGRIPRAIIGAVLGSRLQGKVPEALARRFFSVLFVLIGLTFLLAFSVFARRFT